MVRKLAALVVGGLLLVALLAEFLASDRPIVLRLDGRTYWLPNLVDYQPLDALRGQALSDRMTPDDWALWPPVRHDPDAVRSAGALEVLHAPSPAHLLGTDDRGRDVLARLIHGTRTTLVMALGAAVLALLGGIALGLGAAGGGRRTDAVIVAGCDVAAAVPAILFVVAAQGLLGRGGLLATVILVALPRAADTARIARAGMLGALRSEYCAAARALGAGRARVLVRHALPQTRPQLAIATAITAATAVLAEAALGFLGFGAAPPTASWGELLAQAHENELVWWLLAPAGAAVVMTAAALGALAQPR